ncbi:MAG: DUF4442 domain-containing protein [Bacteroidota bacterium]|nr:DUF4442 domain-containing protein [Bacteroidota bacterium]
MTKTIFKTAGKENFISRLKKFAFNFFPAFRGTGGRVCFLSDDWKEIHIKLGLNWRTKNYVGSVFGGSIYGALDPFYMIQLIQILGNEYVVWDKAANIKFIKPIKRTVYAKFLITDELVNEIKEKVKVEKKYIINLTTTFLDESNIVYAEVIKTIYIADKEYYQTNKKGQQKD